MRVKKNNEENIEMKKLYGLVNKLVKENKIKFGFYNSQKSLDLLHVNVNIKMNIFSNLIMQKNLHFYIVIHHRF